MAGSVPSWRQTALPSGPLSQVFSSALLSQVTWASCPVGSSQCKVRGGKGSAHSFSRAPHTHGFTWIFFKQKCVFWEFAFTGNHGAAIREFVSSLTTFQELPTCEAVTDAITSHPRAHFVCSGRPCVRVRVHGWPSGNGAGCGEEARTIC